MPSTRPTATLRRDTAGADNTQIDADNDTVWFWDASQGLRREITVTGLLSAIDATFLTEAEAASTYLPLAGGGLTGDLYLRGNQLLLDVDGNSSMQEDGSGNLLIGSDGDIIFTGANQGAPLADVSTGTDAAYETAINGIIAALEAHGILASV